MKSNKINQWEKLNQLAENDYGEFGFACLNEEEMAQYIKRRTADKLAREEYFEDSFICLTEEEMETLINNNINIVKSKYRVTW